MPLNKFFGGQTAFPIEVTQEGTDSADHSQDFAGTSWTSASVGLGATDPNRHLYIQVFFWMRDSGGHPVRWITSMTVGGTSAYRVSDRFGYLNGTGADQMEVWRCNKTTGTSANIAINFNATVSSGSGGGAICVAVTRVVDGGGSVETVYNQACNACYQSTISNVSIGQHQYGIVTAGNAHNQSGQYLNFTSGNLTNQQNITDYYSIYGSAWLKRALIQPGVTTTVTADCSATSCFLCIIRIGDPS